MRHRLGHKKLNISNSSHRKAMLANMACALIAHEAIQTTLSRAKVLRPYVERLITEAKKAKNNNLATTRALIAKLKNPEIAKKLIDNVAPRFMERQGGYLRILKAGYRYGDAAPVAYIALVDRAINSTSKTEGNDNPKNLELTA